MKNASLRFILFCFVLAVVFSAGAIAGFIFAGIRTADLLCSAPELSMLQRDLSSDTVYLKKGTLVVLRRCEYADRFSIRFHADNKLDDELFTPFKPTAPEETALFQRRGLDLAQYPVGIASEDDRMKLLSGAVKP